MEALVRWTLSSELMKLWSSVLARMLPLKLIPFPTSEPRQVRLATLPARVLLLLMCTMSPVLALVPPGMHVIDMMRLVFAVVVDLTPRLA